MLTDRQQQLQKGYLTLSKYYDDFAEALFESKGSNKKQREKGQRDYEAAINKARYELNKNPYVYQLYDESEFSNPTTYEGFWGRCFEGDMRQFLKLLKSSINQ